MKEVAEQLILSSANEIKTKRERTEREIREKRKKEREKYGDIDFGDHLIGEYKISKYLQDKLGGQTEVNTPTGKIDLLTDSLLIEIKEFANWKTGIGQLFAYGYFYPSHKKVLYFYGRLGDYFKIDLVVEILSSLGIEPMFVYKSEFDKYLELTPFPNEMIVCNVCCVEL